MDLEKREEGPGEPASRGAKCKMSTCIKTKQMKKGPLTGAELDQEIETFFCQLRSGTMMVLLC